MQVLALTAIFKADFGRFRPVPAVSAAGRFDPIWPIQPDFGRISPIRRKSEKKKKKKNADAVRRAGNRVKHGCGTSSAASVLSSLFKTLPCINF